MTLPNWVKARPRFYYGWYVLGVSMTGGFMSAGFSQVFLGVMLKPIAEVFGWSRTAIAGAATAGTWTSGLLAPFVGRLADRFGPRVLSSGGILVVATLFFVLASVGTLWQFYAAYLAGRAIAQSTLSGVVPRTAAVNWFRRMRGRALGMTQMAVPLGGAVLVLVAQSLMGSGVDWRTVFVIFGFLSMTLFVPMVLVLRRRPEDMGLLPDGDERREIVVGEDAPSPAPVEEHSWTLGQAQRTVALWLIIAALSASTMANGAVGFHMVAYFTDLQIAASFAVVALSAYQLSGAVANGLWGFLVERFSERYLATGTMAMSGLLSVYLLFVSTPASAMVFAVFFGLAARGEGSIVMMILAKYYGRSHFGAISGFTTPFQWLGLGFGPLMASLAFDISGTYVSAFTIVAGVYAVAALLIWLAKRPPVPVKVTVQGDMADLQGGTRHETAP